MKAGNVPIGGKATAQVRDAMGAWIVPSLAGERELSCPDDQRRDESVVSPLVAGQIVDDLLGHVRLRRIVVLAVVGQ
jgi:hypothetical protein